MYNDKATDPLFVGNMAKASLCTRVRIDNNSMHVHNNKLAIEVHFWRYNALRDL